MNTFLRVYVNTQEHRRSTKRIEEYCREHSRFKSIALENPFSFFFSNKIERITFLTRVQPLLFGPFKTVLCSIIVLDCLSPLFFRTRQERYGLPSCFMAACQSKMVDL